MGWISFIIRITQNMYGSQKQLGPQRVPGAQTQTVTQTRGVKTRFVISHKQQPPAFQDLSVLRLRIHITFNPIVSIIGIYSISIEVRCVRSQRLGEAGQGSCL